MRDKIAVITKVFMLVVLTVIIGWDVVAAVWGHGCTTISCIGGKTWSFDWATIPFAWGALTGHLFWIVRGKIEWRWIRLGALIAITIAVIVLDIVDLYDVIPIVPALIGIPLGHFGWPQSWNEEGHPLFIWKS